MILRHQIAEKIQEYLKHSITPAQLVDWAETSIMTENFENKLCRDIVAQLGISDVKSFGLTFQDCENMLKQLGYEVNLNFKRVA